MGAAITLPDLIERYSDEDHCREALEALRWPEGVTCLRCQSKKISRIKTRHQFDCDECRYRFSVRAGTIFQDSKLPLYKWFLAVYLICESKKGISSNQLARMLKVTTKTAWFLTHRIRAAMADDETAGLLDGIVEVDETYVGGKRRHVGHGYRGNKTMVLGAVARGGEVRLKVDKRPDRKTLHTFIRSVVDDDAEAIFTDELPSYRGIADENTRHETVNHHAEEWVRGDVHTNGVEGVWSLLKRSIVGSYHQLSAKHLPAYLDEMAFRFNNRENPYLFRDTLLALLHSDNLTYSALVGSFSTS